MRNKSYDLGLIVAVAIGVVALTLGNVQNEMARALLGVPLVLGLTGYGVTEAIFSTNKLALSERVTWSLGLSLVITILSSLILNLTPQGLQPNSWAIILSGVTLGASFVAFLRRRKNPIMVSNPFRGGIRIPQLFLFGLAILITAGAIMLAQKGATEMKGPGFTQLWMLSADNPRPDTIRLGINNLESKPMGYALRVNAGSQILGDWNSLSIESGQSWESTIDLPSGSESPTVEAQLYRLDAPQTPYRHVTLWLR